MSIQEHRNNKYSQFGEDGLVKEIFTRVTPKNYLAIEFGAWDGKYLSNTYDLWFHDNWNAILIEGEKKRFERLLDITKEYEKVKCYHGFVRPTGKDSLDSILESLEVSSCPDLLSIDIDGDEYHILENLKIRPKLIIVEYNPTIPPYMNYIQTFGDNIGSSAKSLVDLGTSMRYKLVAITDTNLFLFDTTDPLSNLLDEIELFDYFPYQYLRSVIESYKGEKFVSKEDFTYSQFDKNISIPKWKAQLLGVNVPKGDFDERNDGLKKVQIIPS